MPSSQVGSYMSFEDPRQYACTRRHAVQVLQCFYIHKIYGVRKLTINHSVDRLQKIHVMSNGDCLQKNTIAIESPNFLAWHQEAVKKVCKEMYAPSVVSCMLVSCQRYLRTQARFVVECFVIAVSEWTLRMLHVKIWDISRIFHSCISHAVPCRVFDNSGRCCVD